MLGLLRGKALTWAEARFAGRTFEDLTFSAFLEEFRQVFAAPAVPFCASSRLFAIIHGRRSVAEYTLEFRTLAADVVWTEDSLCTAYYNGLCEYLKDELAYREEPAGPEALIKLTRTVPVPPRILRSSMELSPNPTGPAPESPSVPAPEEPMQVGGAHLSSEERGRWLQAAAICFQLQQLPLQALIDSGAEENFIDERIKRAFPLNLWRGLAVDGRKLAQVTHRTVPVTHVLSGNHVETIQLLVIYAPNTPLIMGYPWLAKQNPHIDWALGKVLNWSLYCHEHCLQSALSPTGGAPVPTNPPAEPVDVTGVPAVYHDLKEVFSKDKPLFLPPHHPYDCAIDLLPDAPLPSSRLYNLSRPEQEAMEKYIKDSLAAGIIRPSKSPVVS
ncbi:hypothetical protein L3Q82_003419 [Scortum barcoo]|uniref:Uncharacterized protein n=1 Tax=Scortum barcoo TaxID=214431 RepID=A0ACB8VQF7_9TELE|nr:hypothetical protein L3Q82_003419 [Scortum barcoo]